MSVLELIRDQKGGATQVDPATLSNAELQARVWTFPECRSEYLKRFLANSGQIPQVK